MRAPSHATGVAGLLLTLVGFASGTAAESPPTPVVWLTNAAQVRNLTAAQAAQAIPVRLRGVVIDESEPRERALILADPTAGIYLLSATNLFSSHRRGEVLEISGVTDPGEFAPIVLVSAAQRRGTASIPAARVVTYQQLITGALDAQWVEIAGVVRRCVDAAPGSDVWRIIIAAEGGIVPVRLSWPRDPKIQEDAEVRLQAVCLYQFNQKRQVVTPVLQIPAGVPVRVEKPAPMDPYSAPVRTAHSLLLFAPESPNGHRVRVRGIVTHCQPGSFVWIRDASSGLRLQTRQPADLQAGDEIDVLGFPVFGSHSPVLEDAIFRKTGSARPPPPLTLTNMVAAFDHEDDLVATEARLTEIQAIHDGFVFTLDSAGTVFKAVLKLSPSQRHLARWQPGSQVRVAGICSVVYDDPRPVMGVWHPQAIQLLVRSPADLTVLKPPPWWTPRNVILVLGFFPGVLLLVTGVVAWRARRRVREQAQQRTMAEAEFAAILSERNRVAREIHDTLAQGLVATSVQLRLARKHMNGDSDPLRQHLDAAQQLVRGNLEEARNSIWNMRAQVLETGDLAGAVAGILKQMTDGTELKTSFEVTGRARRLAPVIENNLLRVGQEAITNATKHARASQLKVTLGYGEKQFRLTVTDDGQGFDAAKPPPGNRTFGLVGMRERAGELEGELHIRSAPGQGTEISLNVPLRGE